MRLHLTDYHLASARLALAGGDGVQAHTHFEEAEALVQKTRLTAVLLPTAFWSGGAACQPWSISGEEEL